MTCPLRSPWHPMWFLILSLSRLIPVLLALTVALLESVYLRARLWWLERKRLRHRTPYHAPSWTPVSVLSPTSAERETFTCSSVPTFSSDATSTNET